MGEFSAHRVSRHTGIDVSWSCDAHFTFTSCTRFGFLLIHFDCGGASRPPFDRAIGPAMHHVCPCEPILGPRADQLGDNTVQIIVKIWRNEEEIFCAKVPTKIYTFLSRYDCHETPEKNPVQSRSGGPKSLLVYTSPPHHSGTQCVTQRVFMGSA